MNYRLAFTPQAKEDFDFWKATDAKTTERIRRMLKELQEHPFSGTGKPEALRWQYSGAWSRRINRRDRMVYTVDGELVTVIVLALSYHYKA